MRAQRATSPAPLWLQHPDKPYWHAFLDGGRTLYVQYNQVQDEPGGEPISAYFPHLFAQADRQGVERVIIDVRLNGGGNNELNRPIWHALLRSDRLNQKGRLWVVIGPKTFSAAMNFVDDMELNTHATFVGEPTGETPNMWGDPVSLTLPNSGIVVQTSTLWWQMEDPRDHRAFRAPDIPVQMSFADYAEQRRSGVGRHRQASIAGPDRACSLKPASPEAEVDGTRTARAQRRCTRRSAEGRSVRRRWVSPEGLRISTSRHCFSGASGILRMACRASASWNLSSGRSTSSGSAAMRSHLGLRQLTVTEGAEVLREALLVERQRLGDRGVVHQVLGQVLGAQEARAAAHVVAVFGEHRVGVVAAAVEELKQPAALVSGQLPQAQVVEQALLVHEVERRRAQGDHLGLDASLVRDRAQQAIVLGGPAAIDLGTLQDATHKEVVGPARASPQPRHATPTLP